MPDDPNINDEQQPDAGMPPEDHAPKDAPDAEQTLDDTEELLKSANAAAGEAAQSDSDTADTASSDIESSAPQSPEAETSETPPVASDAAESEQARTPPAAQEPAAATQAETPPAASAEGGELGAISLDEIQAAMAAAEEQVNEEATPKADSTPPATSSSISNDEIEAALKAAQGGGAATQPAANDESDSLSISAEEIEAAMNQMLGDSSKNASQEVAAQVAGAAAEAGAPNDVEAAMMAMLEEAEQTPAPQAAAPPQPQAPAKSAAPPPETQDYSFEEFSMEGGDQCANIDLLDDVELEVKIELGRTEMYIEDVLGLGPGSVVELDRAAGDPVDIFVNERLVARGEVLVLNDSFCVRINDILSPIPELEQE